MGQFVIGKNYQLAFFQDKYCISKELERSWKYEKTHTATTITEKRDVVFDKFWMS